MKMKRLVVDLRRNTMQSNRKIVRLTELHVLARIYGMNAIKVLGFWDGPEEDVNPQQEYNRLARMFGEHAMNTYGEYLDGRIHEIMKNGYGVFGDLKTYIPSPLDEDPLAELDTDEEPEVEEEEPPVKEYDKTPLKSKKNVVEVLEKLGIEFDAEDSYSDLKELLTEDMALQFSALNEQPMSESLESQVTELYEMRGL